VVDNAIKYSAGGHEGATVTVSLDIRPDQVAIVVDDEGPGIPADDLQRATERFVRLEQSRTKPGSGLGLSLAKAVMKFHGGRLELTPRAPGLSVAMMFPGEKRVETQQSGKD
jgi:signal transduction histidine kinase